MAPLTGIDLAMCTSRPPIMHVTNMPAPIADPSAIRTFPERIAATLAEMSGAPLAQARRVTPASLGESLRLCASVLIADVKYTSATCARDINNNANHKPTNTYVKLPSSQSCVRAGTLVQII